MVTLIKNHQCVRRLTKTFTWNMESANVIKVIWKVVDGYITNGLCATKHLRDQRMNGIKEQKKLQLDVPNHQKSYKQHNFLTGKLIAFDDQMTLNKWIRERERERE